MPNTDPPIVERLGDQSVAAHVRFLDDPRGGIWDEIYRTFGTVGYNTRYELKTIDDPGDKKDWKNLSHYKRLSFPPSNQKVTVSMDCYSWNPGWDHYAFCDVSLPGCFYNQEYGPLGELNIGLPKFWDDSYDQGVRPPDGLSGLLYLGFKSIIPKIKADLSSLNSVLELKDFKDLPSSLKRAGSIFRGGAKTLRDLVRVGAGDYFLQWKFNVGPLISDICGVYSALSRIERRINDLVSRQGRHLVGHFSKGLTEYVNSHEQSSQNFGLGWGTNGWYSDRPISGLVSNERFTTYSPSVFHVEIEYSYYYTQFQAVHARLLGLLDMIGVNLNPAILWNAIPWSFVVDWLAGVSRFLSDFHLGNMDPAVCIHRALWSIKRSRRILVQSKLTTPSNGYIPMPPQSIPVPLVDETSYRRQLFNWKDMAPSLTVSGLTFMEGSLAAALVLSRRTRKRRRGN